MKPIQQPKTFSELNYMLKAGKLPSPTKEKHTGSWSLYYGSFGLEYNLTYGQCVKRMAEYKMQGARYPKKDLFTIKPYKDGRV